MIDLSIIESGEEFELFCEDLLKAKKYNIISRVSRGPDEGNDIIAAKSYTDELGYVIDLKVLVECKHNARSRKSVLESDVGNVIERTLRHRCNRYLLITSTLPCTKLANQLEAISSNPAIQILAAFWSKNNLDEMLLEFPDLKNRYFFKKRQSDEIMEPEVEKWNVIIHEHPDFSEELKEVSKIWNESQNHFLFTVVRPSRQLDEQLLSSGKIHENSAIKIADSIRKEAGFNSDDEIIQFCEKRLYGDEYHQLFSSGTLHDEEPPNTSTISLDYMRKLSKGQIQGDSPLLAMILQNVLHVITSGIGIEPHDNTRGCIMDFCENMDEILQGLCNGPEFCPACKKQLQRMGANYILKIAEKTNLHLITAKRKENKVSIRMGLREKRRGETGEDWSYDVAFSFVGKDRELAMKLAKAVKKRNVKVLYDEFEKSHLWGEDLYSYLDELYRFRARFCIKFISRYYANTLWNDAARRAAEIRTFMENQTAILPIRIDNTEIPGVPSSIAYIRWQDEDVENIADMIVRKLQKEMGIEAEFEKTTDDNEFVLKLRKDKGGYTVSPFIFNNPVTGKNFFNREKLLKEMMDFLFKGRDRGNVWLLGQRQTGKTSLLKHLESEINKFNYKTYKKELVKFVYFDCQAVADKARLIDEIATKIQLDLNLSSQNKKESPDHFTSVFREILDKRYYIILMLDEFDSLIDCNNASVDEMNKGGKVVKAIRVVINGIPKLRRQPKLISAVFASDHRYIDLAGQLKIGSPLNYLEMEIEWFDDSDIEELIRQYLPEDTRIFAPGDIRLCFQLSKGHPQLVQKVLDLIYCQKKNGKINEKVIKMETKEFIKRTSLIMSSLKVPAHIVSRLNEIGIKTNIKKKMIAFDEDE